MTERAKKSSTVVSAIRFGDEILMIYNDIKMIVGWAVFTAIWMITAAIALLVSAPLDALRAMVFFGVILGLFIPYIIIKGVKVSSHISNWAEAFLPFSYILKFEIMPPTGKTPDESVLNKILSVHIDRKDYVRKRPNLVHYNAKVRGKKSNHQFDVYVRLKRFHEEIFIRRFEKSDEVTREDLETFDEEVFDVLKKHNSFVLNMTVVTTTSFSEDAIEYAKDEENWVTEKHINLVVETLDGYRVVWAGE